MHVFKQQCMWHLFQWSRVCLCWGSITTNARTASYVRGKHLLTHLPNSCALTLKAHISSRSHWWYEHHVCVKEQLNVNLWWSMCCVGLRFWGIIIVPSSCSLCLSPLGGNSGHLDKCSANSHYRWLVPYVTVLDTWGDWYNSQYWPIQVARGV